MRKAAGSRTTGKTGARTGPHTTRPQSDGRAARNAHSDADILPLLPNPQAQRILFQFATNYVKQHNDDLKIPQQWLADLDWLPGAAAKRSGAHLEWLPFTKTGKKNAVPATYDPRGSFPYVRKGADGQEHVLLVMLASLMWRDKRTGNGRLLRGGQGLRVVARVVFDRNAKRIPRFDVVASSTSLPTVPGNDVKIWNDVLDDADVAFLLDNPEGSLWPDAAGLDPAVYGTHSVGLRLDDPSEADGGDASSRFLYRVLPRRAGSAQGATAARLDASAYAVEATVRSGQGGPPILDGLHRYPLFAHLKKNVFAQDPPTGRGSEVLFPNRRPGVPSGRPARSQRDLDLFRASVELGPLPGAGPGLSKLEDPNGRFFVAQSRHVEGGTVGFDENSPVVIADASDSSSRTDGFAAVNAYRRAAEFFWRVEDFYQLPMSVHFGFVNLPLIVRYRSGTVPGGGDGRTINAQVRWAPTSPPTAFPSNLEVRLALADLQSNEGRVSAVRRTGQVRRAPLSIAAAPRWCWHEFGHVLIAGATGALELEFAHSVGDALGAILCDPRSELAADGTKPKWRGVTYPWQSLPSRRHDREASDGWSWSGTHARPNRQFAGVDGHHALNRGGYCSEQLLSSTLFRFYLALGGDAGTTAGKIDHAMREVAAEHAVALIMAAIGTFGAATASVVRRAEDFANSLMGVDRDMPPVVVNGRTRYGGMAHKVARWAFERQGAFPPAGAIAWAHNAPGLPPATDVFVASLRAGEAGGYAPVKFGDNLHHAHRTALWVRRTPSGAPHQDPKGGAVNYVFVRVGNRGQVAAPDTTVRAWRARLLPGGRIPAWTDPAWAELAPHTVGGAGPKNVPAGSAGVRFGPFRWPGAVSNVRYALLVATTCGADPSNLDATPTPPCATSACDVGELVAFDNNLGLTTVRTV